MYNKNDTIPYSELSYSNKKCLRNWFLDEDSFKENTGPPFPYPGIEYIEQPSAGDIIEFYTTNRFSSQFEKDLNLKIGNFYVVSKVSDFSSLLPYAVEIILKNGSNTNFVIYPFEIKSIQRLSKISSKTSGVFLPVV